MCSTSVNKKEAAMNVEVTREGLRESRNSPQRQKDSSRRWTQEYTESSEADNSEWDSEASSYTSDGGSRCRKGWAIVCFTFLLAGIVAGIVVAVLIPLHPKNQSNSFGGSQLTSESPPDLPEACIPAFNNVDYCLKNEIDVEEVDDCVDCVWQYLPESTDVSNPAACQQLEATVCNILSQCPCASCASLLEEYLDCQSGCEFDCQLVSSVERIQDDYGDV